MLYNLFSWVIFSAPDATDTYGLSLWVQRPSQTEVRVRRLMGALLDRSKAFKWRIIGYVGNGRIRATLEVRRRKSLYYAVIK